MNNKFYILYFIIFLALALRLLGINHGLPYNNRIFYETEEASTIKTAMSFGSGDLNPHTFNKPSFFYYFIFFFYAGFFAIGKIGGYFHSAVDFAAYYFNNPAAFYLIARVLVAIMGSACVYLIYLIGKKNYGQRTGIMSALFLAVCGIHITYSRYAQVDIPQLLFILLSIYFALNIDEEGKLSNYVWAGLFAGIAASTKYYGGFSLLVPISLHFLNRRSFDRKLLYLILFCVMGFIIFTPFALIDFKTFIKHTALTKYWAQDRSMISEPLPVWAIEYIKDLSRLSNFGFPLTLISICGVFYAFLRHKKKDISLLLFLLFVYVYFSFTNLAWSSTHYLLPIIPLLILFGSNLVDRLISLLPRQGLFLSVVAILLTLQPAIYNIRDGYLLSHKSTTNLAKDWIEENIPPQSKISMDIFYVPQLTLTKGSLERLKDYWSIHNNQTAENLRKALNVTVDKRSRLAELKDKSITENGWPYDVYFIDYDNFLTIFDYIEKYGIQYVILSSWVGDIYNGPFRSAKKAQANYFYDSVRRSAILLKEIQPNKINLPGTGLQIYKISGAISNKRR